MRSSLSSYSLISPFSNRSRILQISVSWSYFIDNTCSKVFPKILLSAQRIYMRHSLTRSMYYFVLLEEHCPTRDSRINVVGLMAFMSPNNIFKYSNWPRDVVMKDVYLIEDSTILMWWKPFYKSKQLKILFPFNRSKWSSINGIGKLFLIEILFISR